MTQTSTSDAPTRQLPQRVEQLVADEVLTVEQAQRVLAAIDYEPRTGAPAAPPRPWMTRLAEVGAYLGAALMVAAGGVVVAQNWDEMSYALRVGVLGATTVLLVLGALVIVGVRGNRPWAEVANGGTVRRLCGTLFSFGGAVAFATVMVALLSEQVPVDEFDVGRATLLAGAVAFGVLLVGRWQAPTALGEIGLFGATVAMVMGIVTMSGADDRASAVALQWVMVSVGLAWAIASDFTHLLRHSTLGSALGLTLAVIGAATHTGVTWSDRLALLAVVAVSLAIYLTHPRWPWIAAAIVTAVILTVVWVGDAVGVALALLTSGVLVLVLAGGALYLRMRRDTP